METYQLLSGETIEYETPSLEVQDFLARVRESANNPNISLNDLLSLIYGEDNPLLDKTILPGRPMVTKAVFANPIYQVMSDQIGIKRASLGLLDVQKSRTAYTLDVNEAARLLQITPVSVRNAINAKKLAAVYDNGQWWIHPNSVESYKVSNRGRSRSSVTIPMGSESGKDSLSKAEQP